MEKKSTQSKRYICLARASDASEGTSSTEAQIELLRTYGERMGMTFVDQIVLDGVTGSLPGRREDMSALLERKRLKNDFDVVVLQRLDRLTRSGSAHGFWFEHECARHGVQLLFVGDDIPDGRYANLIKVAKYEAAQEQAFSISQRSTQGAQLALEDGRNVTSSHTPFGCWRLYLTADGTPSHVIADLRDGRQQKLDPTNLAVVDTYGHIGGGSKGHYRKQKSERVLLMPGAPAEVAVVREIFELHFRQGWGGRRIADVLNRRGVRSPTGKAWSQHQVEVIYEQEVYTGRSIGNRTSSAIYHERYASAPKRVDLSLAIHATAKNIPVRQRPREEWFVQNQPMMLDFLEADLRERAMEEHERLWRDRHDPDRPKRSKSRHQASDYLLTGLLFAKQDEEPLVGVLCGRVGKKVRYYRHRKGRRGYMKGSIFNRMLPAKALEEAVIDVVAQLLTSDTELHERLKSFIQSELDKPKQIDQLNELQQKCDQIRRRTELIVASLDEETLRDAKNELDRLRAERRSLDEQIAALEGASALIACDPTAVADAVIHQLRTMAANVHEMPTFALRQFLGTVVERIVVDMESKSVELRLTVPVSPCLEATDTMRLVGNSASSTYYQTHPPIGMPWEPYICSPRYSHSRVCYECRRKAA